MTPSPSDADIISGGPYSHPVYVYKVAHLSRQVQTRREGRLLRVPDGRVRQPGLHRPRPRAHGARRPQRLRLPLRRIRLQGRAGLI